MFASGDIRNTLPRFADAARQANHNLVQLIGEIAKRKNATPAQGRARVAVGPEAVDRSHSGDDQVASS
jgi:hypothetical protein